MDSLWQAEPPNAASALKWFSAFTVKWMLAVCLTAIRQLLRPEMVWFCGERRGFIVGHKKDLAGAEQGCFFSFVIEQEIKITFQENKRSLDKD